MLLVNILAPIVAAEFLEPFGTPLFFVYLMLSILMSLQAGMMSGLTVGFLAIDKLEMKIKEIHGT